MDFLKRRADEFHDMSEKLLPEKKYAMAAFCIEQAIQFEMKYFIGARLGDFPKTHRLLTLLEECIKLCPELSRFSKKENATLVSHIEDAYIMSRYYDKEYREDEVKEMLDFYTSLLQALEECRA